MLNRRLTRRDFLKFSAAAGGSALLAACGGGAAGPAACAAPTGADTIALEELTRCAGIEGTLTTIALPHDWANYGEIISTFRSTYNLAVNELDPYAGSSDELEAIKANQGSTGPQAPDVVDIGVSHTARAIDEGLLATYKVATWDTIPLKNDDGYWWAEYYGVLSFEANLDLVDNVPEDWEDLLDPQYAGMVAMAGDPSSSNEAINTVLAAGLSRTNNDWATAPQAGLEFWKEMVESGNFNPVTVVAGTLASGETPIGIQWDYLAIANNDTLAGNPELAIVVPHTGVIAGPYAGGISAYAPHPYAARLWWEFVMSDQGQLLYLRGYAHPIRFNDLAARGLIDQFLVDFPDVAAKLPPAEAYEVAIFPTVEQLVAAREHISTNWRSFVFGE